MSSGGLRRGLTALAVTGVLWGSIGIVVRLLQDAGSSTQTIAFWRFVCACAVLVPVLGPRGLRRLRVHLRRPVPLAAVSAGSLAFQLLFFVAVRDVGVAVGTLIALGLAPVALTAVEILRSRVLPTPRVSLVLLAALAGLALVTSAGGADAQAAPHPVRGALEAVASGLFYAASTSWSGKLSARVEPLAITLVTSAVGVVVLLPVVAVTGWEVPRTTSLVAGVVWLGVITTVVAYGLFYAGLRSTPGNIALIVTLLEPVTAVVLAAIVLDESLTIANVAGGLLLLSGIVVLYLRPPSRDRVG